MPIHCPIQLRALSAEEFEERDYRIMGHAYRSQNDLGRLCDERVYEADLSARLLADGFHVVQTQLPVTLTHRDFFRMAKVQGRLLATSLTHKLRRQFREETSRWRALSPECESLRQTLLALLADWGAFLELNLYQEALVHFLGGESKIAQRLPMCRQGIPLGGQRFLAHGAGVAFRLTAMTENIAAQEANLRRLLALTELRALQWINLNHADVQFVTLLKGNGRGTVARE